MVLFLYLSLNKDFIDYIKSLKSNKGILVNDKNIGYSPTEYIIKEDKIKSNKSTLLFTMIMFILLSPLSFGLWLMIEISKTFAEKTLSIYLLKDLILLVGQVFFPLIILIVSGHWISFAIMSLNKDKYNMKLYLMLLLFQSLPFGIMLAGLNVNTSLEYKDERIRELIISEDKYNNSFS